MRDNKGRFVKGVKPVTGFKKGNVPWNFRGGKKDFCLCGKMKCKKSKSCFMCFRDTPKKVNKPLCFKCHKTIFWGRKLCTMCHHLEWTGKNNPNWRGGKTSENEKIRKSKEYELWRISVFIRDNYTCQECGHKGGNLNVDHIKQFAYFPQLRFAIDNGRTLCVECHRGTKTYGWNKTKYKNIS